MGGEGKNTGKPDNAKGTKLTQLVLDSLKGIDNGSVTIVKQDDHIIQINRSSRIFVNC
jgi:hypothetical protein